MAPKEPCPIQQVVISSSPVPQPSTPKLKITAEIPGTLSPFFPSPTALLSGLHGNPIVAKENVGSEQNRNGGPEPRASIWELPEGDLPQFPILTDKSGELDVAAAKNNSSKPPAKPRTKKASREPTTGARTLKFLATKRPATIKTGTKSHYFESPSAGLHTKSLSELVPDVPKKAPKKKAETSLQPKKRVNKKRKDVAAGEDADGVVVDKPVKRPRGRSRKEPKETSQITATAVGSPGGASDATTFIQQHEVSKVVSAGEIPVPKRPRGKSRQNSLQTTLSPQLSPDKPTAHSATPVEAPPSTTKRRGTPKKTPTPDTTKPTENEAPADQLPPKCDVIVIATSSPVEPPQPEPDLDVLGEKLESIRYSENSRRALERRSVSLGVAEGSNLEPLVKKRCIEILDRPTPPLPPPLPQNEQFPKLQKVTKPKQPRKRAKTITEKATAQYREAPMSPITACFPPEPSPPTTSFLLTKIPKKKTTRKSKAKKEEEVIKPLLSPGSAKARFDAQELVFGTSSQLELGDVSPGEKGGREGEGEEEEGQLMEDGLPPSTNAVRRSFLGTLSKARKGGKVPTKGRPKLNLAQYRYQDGEREEKKEVEEEEAQNEEPKKEPGTRMTESRLKKRTTGGGLWSAASRDLRGGLLEAEVVDLTASPAANDTASPPLPAPMDDDVDDFILYMPSSPIQEPRQASHTSETLTWKEKGLAMEDEDEFKAYIPDSPIPASPPRPEKSPMGKKSPKRKKSTKRKKSVEAYEGEDVFYIPDSPPDRTQVPPSPTASLPKKGKKHSSLESNLESPPPSSQLLPSRKNKKRKSASPDPISSPSPSLNSQFKAKKPKGKSKDKSQERAKAKAKEKTPEEMPDFASWKTTRLEQETTKYGFKKMRNRAVMVSILEQCWRAKHPRPPASFFRSVSPEPGEKMGEGPKATEAADPEVLTNISKAVRNDREMWERILKYEPVIVDELARWLNVKGLGAVGVDEEVGPEIVREWCEGRSVCCVAEQWRNGK